MKQAVVFVEDQTLATAVQQALSDKGNLKLHVATSKADVLAVLDETTILLTDLLSPDDLQFLREIRQAAAPKSSAPVVVLTSQANEKLAVQALRSLASSYVPQRLIESELLATLESVFAVAQAHRHRCRVVECLTHWNTEFSLENDPSLIGPLVRYLQESTQRMGLLTDPGEETRMGIALEEALLNSMYHGNLEVSSKLREEDDKAFYQQVETRRRQPPYQERRVVARVEIGRTQAVFVISDDGPGFDVSSVPDPTEPANVERVCGRGMLLMRSFMDEVQYNAVGNEVRLVKKGKSRDSG